MDTRETDVVLVRCRLAQAGALAGAAQRFCAESGLALRLHRVAWSATTGLAYLYAWLQGRAPVSRDQRQTLETLWRRHSPASPQVDVSRLSLMLDVPGRSLGETATHHYVVETDPEEGWADEIARWYDTEHMPGLAAVEGCIHARRFINHDAGPRSLACYDLVGEAPLTSPAWLAVRGTDWSSRARPHFTNTRRTMMEVVA